MSKSIQMKDINNEKMYPHPYYPIGSIYLSVNSTNPSKWFDGTWELIAQGRTIVGVDTNDSDFNKPKKTGGEKEHTLTVDEMPKHGHGLTRGWDSDETQPIRLYTDHTISYKMVNRFYTEDNGGGQSHNNLQPYFTCYIWCRTA